MLVPILVIGAVWVAGRRRGITPPRRVLIIAAVFGAISASSAIPPLGDFHAALGGGAGEWLAAAIIAALVAFYGEFLPRLRARHDANEKTGSPSENGGVFTEAELERYARHIVLREVGGSGQRRLKEAKVLVVGAGGIGSPALLYLAAGGVGTIGVIDDDDVEVANLQRQIIHADARVGWPKTRSAADAITALNPHVEVRPYRRRLTDGIAEELVADYDLALDGTDNLETRHRVNRACAVTGTPLIAAAITQWEGQLSLYHPAKGAPCYACVFPETPAEGLAPGCAESGVIGPLPGILGAMMAVEAFKHLTGAGETLAGRLLIHDALLAESRVIAIKRRPDCPVCGDVPDP